MSEPRYYVGPMPGDHQLYRMTGDQLQIWRGGEWVETTRSILELDGLGGDVYHRVPAEDVEAWQVALK